MTAKQDAFAAGIAAGKTPKAAAVSAGYSAKSARVMGWRLLHNVAVQLEVQRIRAGAPRLVDLLRKNATPLDYLIARMSDPYVLPRIRVRMARMAARYSAGRR